MAKANNGHRKIYVGTHDGVCTLDSSDGGRHWVKGEITPLANAAARLTASPASPQRAYLAAYEAGVYRTDDGGRTWMHLASYPSDYAHSVLAHPVDSQVVYAGGEPAAIYRSSDGGETWQECAGFREVPESTNWGFHAETRDSHVRDLRAIPGNPDIMYVGIEIGGMVRARDGGGSWQQLPGIDDDIHCVDLSSANPDRVYVATAVAPYRSDDGGERWETINNGLERRYTLHIASAPDDPDLVLVTVSTNARRDNPQFYRSTDGGRHWQLIEPLSSTDDMVVAFDWDPADPQRVYAGTDGGKILVSEDRGQTWEGLPVSVPAVAVGALVAGPAF